MLGRGWGSGRRAGVALAAMALLAALAPAARARQSAGFFGVVPQAPLAAGDWNRIAAAGLGVRLPVRWYEVEPRPGEFDFAALDAAMAAAAARGVRVMPQIGGTPSWLDPDPTRPPLAGRSLAAWREFLRELALRYGPRGGFWEKAGRDLPVRRWQIWNEPNFPVFWSPRPSAREYVRLLKASAGAIRAVDRKAVIVAAGLAPVTRQPPPWQFLAEMYRVPGARASFDVAALHPYTTSLEGLEYEVDNMRRVMAAAGDAGTPLLISEVGVASDSEGRGGFGRGRRGQARFLERAFELLFARRRQWRIGGAYWFAWADAGWAEPSCPFCRHAGLFDAEGRPKPAWRALLRVLRRSGVPSRPLASAG